MSDYGRRHLLFEVGGDLFAADVGEVREILEPTDATPVPGAVSGVDGLVNLRGTLIVAGRLSRLLGIAPTVVEEAALVVFEHAGRVVALEVDRVVGVAATSSGELDVSGELLEALGARDVVRGVGQYGSRPYFQLDVGAVFRRVLEESSAASLAAEVGSTEGQG